MKIVIDISEFNDQRNRVSHFSHRMLKWLIITDYYKIAF